MPICSAVQNGDQRWPAKPRSESSRLLLTEGADGEVTPSQCQSRKGEHCSGPATCANAWPSVPPTEEVSFSNPEHAAAGPKKVVAIWRGTRAGSKALTRRQWQRGQRGQPRRPPRRPRRVDVLLHRRRDVFSRFSVFFGVAFFRQQPRLHQFSVATKKERRKEGEGRSGKKEGKAEPRSRGNTR